MTLADEDNDSIPTDDVNRAIIGNVALQVWLPGGQTCSVSLKLLFSFNSICIIFAGEIAQVLESIPWVRCASGNVL